ncbi:NACHT, LRR and PYD domains-containing protein 1 homolog [Hypanus sabinus]|uniref:NACHT, LRR and PYD domains-containing protein 1 homolog n=1 Tax=Hypanus sabinus TaxID=79690 RepID=UPI0028C4486E|nr:NACHT, LRR and PYD domains-containing protein 1 homolog [Hypanus sabinus]
MGFASEKVKEYFRRHLRQGKYTNEIIQQIEQSDILRNMCSNPLFCATLASSPEFHQPQREEQTTMPVINHTQVLFDYVTLLLQECGYDRNTAHKCLREVGELAYKGIKRNKLSFEADALKELNTCPDNFTTVFMFHDPDKHSSGTIYEFRHYVIRDFLAALTHVLNSPMSQLKRILDEKFMDTQGNFRTFLLFLVGLSSRKSTNRLKLELDSVRSDVTLCISEWLTESVNRRLTNMYGKYTQIMFLHTLYCLLEFGDNIIMKKVLSPIAKIKLNHLLLTVVDCAVLSRTLIYSEVIEELNLSSCLAQPGVLQKLEPVLYRCLILRLNHNNLQDSGVKRLFNILKRSDCKIQILELKSNNLTNECLDTLFSALSTNNSLTELNLSNSSQERTQANEFTREKLQNLLDSWPLHKQISTLLQLVHITLQARIVVLILHLDNNLVDGHKFSHSVYRFIIEINDRD